MFPSFVKALTVIAAIAVACGSAPTALAELDGSPGGRVLLVVSGSIEHANAPGEARFDRKMLEDLGVITIRTTTPWTEGEIEFEGVRARDLIHAVGARGERALAVAINDYKVEIPLSDFEDGSVLLALKMNGVPMRVRDKGPIWIIYPGEAGGTVDLETRAKMIWQLKELHVQ